MAFRSNRCISLAGAFALALTVTSPARAEATSADREAARTMMAEARSLRDKGDLKGALQRFKTADSIMHVPTTGLEVARAEVALGQLVEARAAIAALRKDPSSPNDPAPFTAARATADELDTSLEPRIPSVTITVTGAADGDTPAISIDGVSVPAEVASLPRRVDAGHHVVTARSASGQAKQEFDVAEGEKKQIQLVIGGGAAAVASDSASPSGDDNSPIAPAPAAPTSDTGTKVHTPTALTYAGIGVGGAGIITGVVTGLMSLSKASTVKSECPNNSCPPSHWDDLSSANTLATVSTIGFVVGIVGGGVAVASLLIGHSAPGATAASPAAAPPSDTSTDSTSDQAAPAPESRLRITPFIGAGSAGVFGTF